MLLREMKSNKSESPMIIVGGDMVDVHVIENMNQIVIVNPPSNL